jgi:hypothetical protein
MRHIRQYQGYRAHTSGVRVTKCDGLKKFRSIPPKETMDDRRASCRPGPGGNSQWTTDDGGKRKNNLNGYSFKLRLPTIIFPEKRQGCQIGKAVWRGGKGYEKGG